MKLLEEDYSFCYTIVKIKEGVIIMFFEFSVLGLLVMFMLIILYYYKDIRDKYPFNYIIWGSYILQLLYIITYVGIYRDNYNLFGKLYFVCLVLLMMLFSLYNLVGVIRNKYKLNNNICVKKIEKIKWGSVVVGGILSGLVMVSDFSLVDNSLVFGNNIVMIIMWGCVVFNFLVLIVNRYYKMFIFNMLLFFMLGVNYFWGDIGIINSFMVFVTLFLYLVYENPDKKELEDVKLQRDYANKNIIDKYAFLKNLSYEIRGPINTIDGLSQVVMDAKDEKDIKDDLKDIRVASRDLIDIINGMIDLSIIESGSLEIVKDNYNVYDMFDNIHDIMNSKIKDKNIKFNYKIDKNIPEVLLGDSERISQVVLNLLSNSVKFTKNGSINLEVSSVKSETMARIIIKVSDTGEGIKKEQLIHLFERNGNNIGLVLVKYLVDLMRGKIEADSVLGEGTNIVVSIDQKIISLKEERKKGEVKVFKAVGKRVLVVDDNKLNLKVITKMLVPYGIEVVEASSGSECLEILDSDVDFDLIFMDDMMPKLSGTETLSIIKKVSRIDGYYIPVVVLTANVMSGIREKYLGVGFDDYLAKPIDKQELSRVLVKYLKGRKKKKCDDE